MVVSAEPSRQQSLTPVDCVDRIFESEFNRRLTVAMREWQGRGKHKKLQMNKLLKCVGDSMKVS